jgi:uncharacterized membrane protein
VVRAELSRRGRSSRRATRARLDQPYLPRRTAIPRPSYDPGAFGRFSERIARFIGTARFLAIQTVVVLAWIIYNFAAPKSWRFDEYPFIFLTLALSLQAAYAAPLILLAQNRQDDRDRANLAQDREQNARQREDTEYLARELAAMRIALGEVVTRDFLRAELRTAMLELELDGERRSGGEQRDRRRKRKAERAAGVGGGVGGGDGS